MGSESLRTCCTEGTKEAGVGEEREWGRYPERPDKLVTFLRYYSWGSWMINLDYAIYRKMINLDYAIY